LAPPSRADPPTGSVVHFATAVHTREWQQGLAKLHGYHEVKRLGGAGDHGRDVIGLCSPAACEGDWDNYQCKQTRNLYCRPPRWAHQFVPQRFDGIAAAVVLHIMRHSVSSARGSPDQ
jgi:hypothetical protein